MSQQQVLIGLEGAVYYLPSGTARTSWGANASSGSIVVGAGAQAATLKLMNVVRNVKLNLTSSEANVSNRGSDWELGRIALKKGEITFDIPWAPSDPGVQLLVAAYIGRTSIALAVLDAQMVTGNVAQGLWADYSVMELPLDQDLEKEQMITVKVKPTASAVAPEWVQTAAYPTGGTFEAP